MNAISWLRSRSEPRTEAVDHRRLQWTLTKIHVWMGIGFLLSLSVLHWGVGVSKLVLLKAAIIMTAVWLIPFAVTLTAELHKLYWILLVKLGDADEELLPLRKPLPRDER